MQLIALRALVRALVGCSTVRNVVDERVGGWTMGNISVLWGGCCTALKLQCLGL